MYKEEIIISYNIFVVIKRTAGDIRDYYSDCLVRFHKNNKGEHVIKIESNDSDAFNECLQKMKMAIGKLENDFVNQAIKRKIKKERKQRKRLQQAVDNIHNNIDKHNVEMDRIKNSNSNDDIINDNAYKNNMFYGLDNDVECR